MRKIICILLVVSIMMSFSVPSFASEIEEPQYGILNVEFSDAIGSIEQLNVMVNDSHIYADANVLSERLGYECMQEGNVVSIYAANNFFDHSVPLLAVHFRINSTAVSYNPMFGAECKYTAPAPCIENNKGVWVPLSYTLVLLGGNSTLLVDTLLIQMPQENVLSVAAMIVCNDQLLSFDWVDDFGYSETTTDITDGAARIVTLFSGLLAFDGDAWLSLIDWNAFDKKFGKSLATMFCTYSAEELQASINQVETLLDVFDGKAGEMLRNKQLRIDSDVTVWKAACEEYLELLEDGSGSSAKYNLLYQQYERAMDDQSLFAVLGGEDVIHIQNELSTAANVLEIASKIGSAVSYLSEFQQKDAYLISVLKNYLNTRSQTDKMPESTAAAMMKYISSTDDAGQYVFSRFLKEHALELIVDKSGLDAYLGAPANILLLAWDIMSETIPFYSDGLEAVENREISNYAQKMQNDALENLNNLLSKLGYNMTKLSAADCVQLSEYCYVYLKACYIARSAAIESLDNTSKEFRDSIEGKLDVQGDINKIIVRYLAILSSADEENTCYILGFLPDNNDGYLENYSDDNLLSIVSTSENVPTAWNSIYYDAIVADRENSDLDYLQSTWDKAITYEVIYINDDPIPEILIIYPRAATANDSRLLSYSNGQLINEELGFVKWLKYEKWKGTFSAYHAAGGRCSDTIYQLGSTGLEEVACGRFSWVDSNGMLAAATTYTWNDLQVSADEYEQNLSNWVNPDSAISTWSEDSEIYDYSGILDYLSSVEGENDSAENEGSLNGQESSEANDSNTVDNQQVIEAIDALLVGVRYCPEETENAVADWDDETIFDAITCKLLWDDYQHSESSYLSKIGLKYSAGDDGYCHFNLDLIQKISQDAFGRNFPNNMQSQLMFVSGDEVCLMLAMGESTTLSVQSFTKQGNILTAVGSVFHNYVGSHELEGYFQAVLKENPSSLYGYTLISLHEIDTLPK